MKIVISVIAVVTVAALTGCHNPSANPSDSAASSGGMDGTNSAAVYTNSTLYGTNSMDSNGVPSLANGTIKDTNIPNVNVYNSADSNAPASFAGGTIKDTNIPNVNVNTPPESNSVPSLANGTIKDTNIPDMNASSPVTNTNQ